ncbi:MAG: NlpC/P60 family protein [Pedobacter sp.]|nr:MAG: NlpC/P60 family protein [Pedobacter sp.]
MIKKILFISILTLSFSIAGKAQNTQTLPEKYQQMMGGLIKNIPNTNTAPNPMLEFAKTLLGTPYRYASKNPNIGFDCSGFVAYVYEKFGYKSPRSSVEFANKGKTIKLADAKVGDVLVFTGSNSKIRKPGHVGIIYSKEENGTIKFIHSSSGKAKGVTINNLEGYYKNRFLKAVTMQE